MSMLLVAPEDIHTLEEARLLMRACRTVEDALMLASLIKESSLTERERDHVIDHIYSHVTIH